MEELSLTPARRLHARKSYGRAANAFDAVAWRPPTAVRFDPRAANDVSEAEPALKALVSEMPAWVTIVAGGLVAGFIGAMLGGALAV